MLTINITAETPASQVVNAPQLRVMLGGRPARYFHHGWQAWSLAAWTDAEDVPPVPRPRILHPLHVDPGYVLPGAAHGSGVGAVEMAGGEIILLGGLSPDAHIELSGDHLLGTSASEEGAWLVARGPEMAVFSAFSAALGKRLGRRSERRAGAVWCSWYSLYTGIDENLLDRVFSGLEGLPFDVLQVDDGWQQAIGDWEPNAKFPSGMAALAERIRTTGRRAGLWLAPLIAARSSRLFREHRDWFLRDERGRLVSAGFNWGDQLYALNSEHPDALAWLRGLMRQAREWGFDYFKLDFLYAGALPGVRQRKTERGPVDIPREAAYRGCLQALREGMGEDAFFLACGQPILPSIGLCDAMRVGPDVSPEWENARYDRWLHDPAIPGVRNAIRTSVNRLWLSPLVQPDPDVAYFRSVDCSLTPEQKRLLQALALICDFRATSDLPDWLTPDEREQLRSFLAAAPRIEQEGPRTFRIDGERVDFAELMELPGLPRGLEVLPAAVYAWLANHAWALRLNDRLSRRALERKLRALK